MKIANPIAVTLLIFISVHVNAQSNDKNRGLLQNEFIYKNFIMPHEGSLKINSTKTVDSLFKAINNEWSKAAHDTLKKYKLNMPLKDFKNIDAYCYLLTLVQIFQNIDFPSIYKEHLVCTYMIPAMYADLLTLKQRPNLISLKLIFSGTLSNTLAIGSNNNMNKETIVSCYKLYASAYAVLNSYSISPDTAISNYSKNQLKTLEPFKYDLNARFNYYNGNKDISLEYVLSGLVNDDYPKSRVYSMAELLLNDFLKSGQNDKVFKLLNALMLHTTSETIDKATLMNWYLKVDPLNGKKMFTNTLNTLPSSSFIKTGKSIELPEKWNFIANSIDPERIKKVKYYLVDVWYTACGPCNLEIPYLNIFNAKFKDRDDVLFISINTDFINGKMDETYVSSRCKELDTQFAVIYDNANSNISSQLSVDSFPSKFILDSTGQILTKTDNSPISVETFKMFIKELDNGKVRVLPIL